MFSYLASFCDLSPHFPPQDTWSCTCLNLPCRDSTALWPLQISSERDWRTLQTVQVEQFRAQEKGLFAQTVLTCPVVSAWQGCPTAQGTLSLTSTFRFSSAKEHEEPWTFLIVKSLAHLPGSTVACSWPNFPPVSHSQRHRCFPADPPMSQPEKQGGQHCCCQLLPCLVPPPPEHLWPTYCLYCYVI